MNNNLIDIIVPASNIKKDLVKFLLFIKDRNLITEDNLLFWREGYGKYGDLEYLKEVLAKNNLLNFNLQQIKDTKIKESLHNRGTYSKDMFLKYLKIEYLYNGSNKILIKFPEEFNNKSSFIYEMIDYESIELIYENNILKEELHCHFPNKNGTIDKTYISIDGTLINIKSEFYKEGELNIYKRKYLNDKLIEENINGDIFYYFYDNYGNKCKVIYPPSKYYPLGHGHEWKFDEKGNLIEYLYFNLSNKYDNLNYTYKYDSNYRMIKFTNISKNISIEWIYDKDDKLIKIIDEKGNNIYSYMNIKIDIPCYI